MAKVTSKYPAPGKQSEPHRDRAKRAQEIVVDLFLLIQRHADSRGVSERSVTQYSCHFVHEVEEFGHEPSASKPQRGCANRNLVERHSLKSVQTIEEGIHRLLLEQNSGNTRVHNFGGSAAAVGNDAFFACLCLRQNHAEVFLYC